MKKIVLSIRNFLADRFNLNEDKADEQLIIASISRDTSFKGTNLWTLIFATFIASIGLNVNSTAVIIGAMLISPLMGPIMGIGLGIGINDFELLKKGAKNLLIAAIFSIITSCIYFAITPLHEASSEILARTNPSLWDVFVAFLGGLAGIVAGTRKEKSNIIPGVAIATALMPPLCTAGYGLATAQWSFFFGALYLFFINSLFICIATFLIVKHLKFHKEKTADPEQEKQVSRYIIFIVTITIIPSIFFAYRIVEQSIFESNANKFVQGEFHFAKTQVVTRHYNYKPKNSRIELLLVGQPLSEEVIDSISKKTVLYNLHHTNLIIHQGLDAMQKIDLSAIKASVLEEVFAAEHSSDSISTKLAKTETGMPDLNKELKALYPGVTEYSLTPSIILHTDSLYRDTVTLFTAKFKQPLRVSEKKQLSNWLTQRLGVDTLKIIIE